jgi:hypothetical protein
MARLAEEAGPLAPQFAGIDRRITRRLDDPTADQDLPARPRPSRLSLSEIRL